MIFENIITNILSTKNWKYFNQELNTAHFLNQYGYQF